MYFLRFVPLLLLLQTAKSQNPTLSTPNSNKVSFELGISGSMMFNFSKIEQSSNGSDMQTIHNTVTSFAPGLTLKMRNRYRYLFLRYDNLGVGSDVNVTVLHPSGFPLQPGFTLIQRTGRLTFGGGTEVKVKNLKLHFDLGISYYPFLKVEAVGNVSYVLSDSSHVVSIGYAVRSAHTDALGIESGTGVSMYVGEKYKVLLSLVARYNHGISSLLTADYTIHYNGKLGNFRNLNKGSSFSLGLSLGLPIGRQQV
jgi:hypothetical protein